MLKKLKTFNSPNTELNILMNNLDYALDPVFNNPYLSFNIVKNVNLVVGDNQISHGLGRDLEGWVIVRKRGNADIYDKQDTNTLSSKTIIINSSRAVTVDFYFY